MNSPQRKIVGGVSLAALTCLVLAIACHAQAPKPSNGTGSTASQASINAERAAIWNSSDMLHARAWLQDYCNTSKKCQPGDAEKYMNELQNMSPTQMKLWLMKFDEEEAEQQQQQAFWKQVHSIGLSQAKAADKATQQSYAAIEKEETGAANQAQQQINTQQALEQGIQADKQLDGPYGPYGAGYYPGDGVHYHFHLYGN